MLTDVKMEMMQNAMSGIRERITWFDDNNQKQLDDSVRNRKAIARP